MTGIYIVDYARSPFTQAYKGALAGTRPDDLAATVVKALIARTTFDPAEIEDLILGCAFPEGEQGLNLGRVVGLLAGLPQSVGGATVNRWCGSSLNAIQIAAGAIAMGAGEAIVAAGVESMSRVPMLGFNPQPNPSWPETTARAFLNMGLTAETLTERYKLDRATQDAYAMNSHHKAAAARADGRLAAEIVAVNGVEHDGLIRPDSSLEKLGGLKPAFLDGGSVTAGNSSPLTDGASAVLVASESFVKRHDLTPLARIKSFAVAGCAPEIMGIGPVESTRKALSRAGLKGSDLDVIEMNEAFAAQVLACCADLDIDPARLNRDGGAIALGHPLGGTGGRLVGKASMLLKRDGGRYGLATQCIGGGQGISMIVEAA
ncbi:thiolase family protein [Rhodoblastus sp.]|jgi:acetyl-CoA acyltransferase|uniref:thiolase family protein n=1 Tax=Rhodoblastus sp. TaxID=1962975 RepID=UPI0025F43317|nr:thiolase family protein [Rhodoblastus sp.]